MSTFTREEVVRVAALARIDLSDDEIDRLADELAVITSAIQRVREVATPDVPATSHPIPMANVMRPDVVAGQLTNEQALSGAPAAEDGQFLVPQILGEE